MTYFYDDFPKKTSSAGAFREILQSNMKFNIRFELRSSEVIFKMVCIMKNNMEIYLPWPSLPIMNLFFVSHKVKFKPVYLRCFEVTDKFHRCVLPGRISHQTCILTEASNIFVYVSEKSISFNSWFYCIMNLHCMIAWVNLLFPFPWFYFISVLRCALLRKSLWPSLLFYILCEKWKMESFN